MANILTNMKAASFRKIPIRTKTTAASTNIMPAPFNNSVHLLSKQKRRRAGVLF